jgi:hypothetical protein
MNTAASLNYTLNPECIKVDRFMGLNIVFVPAGMVYRVTDVNGISYFESTPDRLIALMKQHGRKHLKRKAR